MTLFPRHARFALLVAALVAALAVSPPARAGVSAVRTPRGPRFTTLTLDARALPLVRFVVAAPAGDLDSATVAEALSRCVAQPLAFRPAGDGAGLLVVVAEQTLRTAPGEPPRLRVDAEPLLEAMRARNHLLLDVTALLPAHTPLGIEPRGSFAWEGLRHASRAVRVYAREPAGPVTLVFGLDPARARDALAWALALLLLPWLVAAAVVLAALRARRARGPGAWFAAMQWLQWLAVGTLLLTFTVVFASPLPDVLLDALTGWLGDGGTALAALALLLPFASVNLASACASHALARALRGTDLTLPEVLRHAAWQSLTAGGVLTGVAGAFLALQRGQFARIPVYVLAGVVLAVIARQRAARALGITPLAVSHGELRDRVTALAARARVPLRQLYVVPMRRSRLANAFAISGNTVLVTDWLLEHLGRDEVDAVLAHELAHLKLRHPLLLALVLVGVTTVFTSVATVTAATWVLPLGVLAGLLGLRLAGRRFEYAADAMAVKLHGDAEALIRALVRLARLNDTPTRWSAAAERAMTHPSVERRVRAIAKAASLPAGRVEELLADTAPPGERYAVPPTLVPGGKVFSTSWKTHAVSRMGLLMLLLSGVLPAAILALARAAAVPRVPAFPLAVLLSFALVLLVTDLLAARGVAGLRSALAARRKPSPLARFVSLSPGPEPRLYEGFLDWDLAFLRLDDALVIEGEEVSLRLPRAAVTGVTVVPGAPGWIESPRVALSWTHAGTDASGVLLLRPADVTVLSRSRAAARALAGDLEHWRTAGPAGSEAWGPLPPTGADVTGQPLSVISNPLALVRLAYLLALVSACACALARLPFWPFAGAGWVDAWLAGVAVAVLQRAPHWRARREPRADVPHEARRAA